tara:strand:- start:5045 stop:6055 length:1011 start_codon:yes stop_codon:yes gene_type:complete
MNGIEKDQTKRSTSCSFCRSYNHNVTKCPHPKKIWASLERGIIPLGYLNSQTTHGVRCFTWYARPSGWSELYKHTAAAIAKQEAYEQRQKQPSRRKQTITCGFCGQDGHTRRSCQYVKLWNKKLKAANKKYRHWVYETLVKQHGLSSGAIVSFKYKTPSNYRNGFKSETKDISTLCTSVNWDSINLFASFKSKSYDWRERSEAQRKGLIDCGDDRLTNITDFLKSGIYLKIQSKGIDRGGYGTEGEPIYVPWHSTEGSYKVCTKDSHEGYQNMLRWGDGGTAHDLKVVSRAPQVLDESWVDGYSDKLSVIFKKFKMNELKFLGVLDHIEEWADGTG